MSDPTIAVAAGAGTVSFSSILIAGVVMGIIAGIGAGVYKTIRNAEDENPNSYKNLITRQYVCDTLDGRIVMNWFQENAGLTKGKPVFFLAKPTNQTSKMFMLGRVPKELDTEHCLLQCVVDEATNLPAAVRLVSFTAMNEELGASMSDKEYAVIKTQSSR